MSGSRSLSPALSDEMEYEYVLKEALGDNGTLKESLAYSGCHNIYDFLSLGLDDIDTLTKAIPAEEATSGVSTRSTASSQVTAPSPLQVPLLLGEKRSSKPSKDIFGGAICRMMASSLCSCLLKEMSLMISGLASTRAQISCLPGHSQSLVLLKHQQSNQSLGLQLRISGMVLNKIPCTIVSFVRISNGIPGGVLPSPLPEHMVVRMSLILAIDLDPLMIKNSLLRSRNSSALCLSLLSRQTWGILCQAA